MIWLAIFNPLTLLLVYIAYAKCDEGSVPYYFTVILGMPIDVVVNHTWFWLLFWERPQDWTLTQRVSRLKEQVGYRGTLANLLCKLLNHFQAGHCR